MQKKHETPRTSAGLAQELFRVLDELNAGKITPQHASSVAKIARTIVSVKSLELEAQRFVSQSRADAIPSLAFDDES